jgi:hypothetical protein
MAEDEPEHPEHPERPHGPVEPGVRLLTQAGRAAAAIVEPHLRAPMLARIAAVRRTGNPRPAAREAARAMGLAQEIGDPYVRSFTLAKVSEGLAAVHPRGAVRAAQAALRAAKVVADAHSRTVALAEAADALGMFDRPRAERVLAEAEQLADETCSCTRRCLLAAVLERVADLDPDEAVRKADQIPDLRARGVVLARAIVRLAAADPQRAVALVGRVPELHQQIDAWVGLCGALAGVDPRLALFAAECAEADAGFSFSEFVQLNALARVARFVHRADPARAERLLATSEAVFEEMEHTYIRALAAAELARAQAVFDAERGERTARAIVQPQPRAHAFVLLAADARDGAGA